MDLTDPSSMPAQFGTSGAALPGDQNRDRHVDLADLAALLSNFGQACP